MAYRESLQSIAHEQFIRKRIRTTLERLGIDCEKLHPDILDRFVLLEKTTPTLDDERRAITYARALFHHYEKKDSEYIFTEREKHRVEIGTIFSDIGKTGPQNATLEQRRIIAEIFGIENHIDPSMSLSQFIVHFFPHDAYQRQQELLALNLDIQMSMRTFWNMHSEWTFDIITNGGVPTDIIPTAASHHRLEGVNPQNIVSDDDHLKEPFGENTKFGRPEKLVILLDKYDAYRRRGKLSHIAAIAALRDRIEHSVYQHDAEFKKLIADMEKVLTRTRNP